MEGNSAAFEIVGGDNGVMPDRREAFAEVLKDDDRMTGCNFSGEVIEALQRNCQRAAAPRRTDHVLLKRSFCARDESKTGNLILRDVLPGPLQNHRQSSGPAMVVCLLDHRNIRNERLSRGARRRRKIEGGRRAGRKGKYDAERLYRMQRVKLNSRVKQSRSVTSRMMKIVASVPTISAPALSSSA